MAMPSSSPMAMPLIGGEFSRISEETGGHSLPFAATARGDHTVSGTVPKEYGGDGASAKTFVEVAQALAGVACPRPRSGACIASRPTQWCATGRRSSSPTFFRGRQGAPGFRRGRGVIDRSAPMVKGGDHANGHLIRMPAHREHPHGSERAGSGPQCDWRARGLRRDCRRKPDTSSSYRVGGLLARHGSLSPQ